MIKQDLKLFDERQIRTIWDEVQEKWYFSVVDVIEVLTDSSDVRQYIKRLRQRDPELNSLWGTICTPHQFISTDGKKHAVNCASIEGVFRIVQSIPSPKAEPFKRCAGSGTLRCHPSVAVSSAISTNRSKIQTWPSATSRATKKAAAPSPATALRRSR